MIEKETLPIRKLDRSRLHEFRYAPNAEVLSNLSLENDWKKLTLDKFEGTLSPLDNGWELKAKLKGIVTQRCVISDAPVSHPFDLDIRRLYRLDAEGLPKDYTLQEDFDFDVEELPRILSLNELMVEEILLDAPDYPKLDKYKGENIWQSHEDEPDEVKKNPFEALKSLTEEKKPSKS